MDKQIELSKAVQTLVTALKTDESYRIGWQANIAMAFKDEYNRTPEVFRHDIRTIANNASNNFLNLLCEDATKN